MFKKLGFCMAALLIGLIFVMVDTSYAVFLRINPSSSSVSQRESFDINIDIGDLGDDLSLGIFDLDLSFSPDILRLDDISFGNQLSSWGLGSYQEETPGSGKINLLEISYESIEDLNDGQASSFSLAKLTFNAIGLRESPLTLSINALGDAEGESITPSSITNGSVTVTASPIPVPLSSSPASIFLLTIGIIGIIGAQRKFSTEDKV